VNQTNSIFKLLNSVTIILGILLVIIISRNQGKLLRNISTVDEL